MCAAVLGVPGSQTTPTISTASDHTEDKRQTHSQLSQTSKKPNQWQLILRTIPSFNNTAMEQNYLFLIQ